LKKLPGEAIAEVSALKDLLGEVTPLSPGAKPLQPCGITSHESGFVKSFNGRLRNEGLNEHLCSSKARAT